MSPRATSNGRKKPAAKAAGSAITPARAARLYQLLTLTAAAARPRSALMKKLKVDLRGFYRDVNFLREQAIALSCDGDRYRLDGDLDEALDKLPFPDPGLSLRDAILLAEGRTAAHRRLKSRLNTFLGTNGHA